MSASTEHRNLAAIMFTDIVGYTRSRSATMRWRWNCWERLSMVRVGSCHGSRPVV